MLDNLLRFGVETTRIVAIAKHFIC